MNKIISLVLLTTGVILIACGLSASDSLGSSFVLFFTGPPADKTMWLLIGGAVAVVIGASHLPRISGNP